MIIHNLTEFGAYLGAEKSLRAKQDRLSSPLDVARAVERDTNGKASFSIISKLDYRRALTVRFRFTQSVLGYTVHVWRESHDVWITFNAAIELGALPPEPAERARDYLKLNAKGQMFIPGVLPFPTCKMLATRISLNDEWTVDRRTVPPAATQFVADWRTFYTSEGSTKWFAIGLTYVDSLRQSPCILEFPFAAHRYEEWKEGRIDD